MVGFDPLELEWVLREYRRYGEIVDFNREDQCLLLQFSTPHEARMAASAGPFRSGRKLYGGHLVSEKPSSKQLYSTQLIKDRRQTRSMPVRRIHKDTPKEPQQVSVMNQLLLFLFG